MTGPPLARPAANRPVTSDMRDVSRTTAGRLVRMAVGGSRLAGAVRASRSRRSSFEDGIEPLALDELHDVEMRSLVLADAEDRHDVGVVQPRRRPRLALEPPHLLGVGHRPLAGSTLRATRRPSDSCSAS